MFEPGCTRAWCLADGIAVSPAGVTADDVGALREALKAVAVRLKEGGFAFALAGGYAAWARGAPEPGHDVDFILASTEVERARAYLAESGLKIVQPPEDWLFKVFAGEAMVDLIHRMGAEPVENGWLDDANEVEVLSVLMPVMSATQIIKSKVRVLDEHDCDYSSLLPVTRALREQVDWDEVSRYCDGNPYAAAFLFLLKRLGVAPNGGAEQSP